MSTIRNLITGGAGFLGSHLVSRLMNLGQIVICLDNYSTGSRHNLEEWLNHPRFTLIEHDIIDSIDLIVDRIWHLACPASPVHYQKDPIKTSKTNFLGTLNMLNLAHQRNARFLFTSTSEVYGDPHIHPQPENYWGSVNPIGVRACYDEGKRLAEALCFDYHRMLDVDIRVVRIFNTYGPRMSFKDGRVMSNFITQALMNRKLTLYGDGTQTRSFCYVDDLIDGLILMMNHDYIGPVNLGNPLELTILQLAELIIQEINPKLEICFKSLPQDDPKQRQPVIDIAKNHLGWHPQINIKEGLSLTIQDFRKRLSK